MRPPTTFSRVVDRIRYDVQKAHLIADDSYWDGRNFERGGRNTFLYRTPKGRFFLVTRTQWQGERDSLVPVDQEEAIELFEGPLTEHHVEFEEAFPETAIEEA